MVIYLTLKYKHFTKFLAAQNFVEIYILFPLSVMSFPKSKIKEQGDYDFGCQESSRLFVRKRDNDVRE
jgi:protoheme ferro-lyase